MSYKVMTYNDGDNKTTKPEQIAAVVKSCEPDLLGLQEVQVIHAEKYSELLSVYDYVYYDNDGTTYNSQPIFWKRDKFELLASGIKWLSDTPDVRSRYEKSAYTRSFTYVILKDKASGGELLYANTHIDYVGEAIAMQVGRLIELTEELSGGRPMIYTADWNMYRDSRGYEILNEHGMAATEEFLPDAVLGGTLIGTPHAIDFCFVERENCRGVSYKIVNDHEYSETASDHYPVVTEIEFTK